MIATALSSFPYSVVTQDYSETSNSVRLGAVPRSEAIGLGEEFAEADGVNRHMTSVEVTWTSDGGR
jgi:hypothetical protein